MQACTFFGHQDCPISLRSDIKAAIENLINEKGIKTFYVGTQGKFDQMVQSVLEELSAEYPELIYFVVLAYMPCNSDKNMEHTLYPEGIETAPKRFAIPWRNRWMLKRVDYVITYIEHDWGGAATFAHLAEKQGKKVYNLTKTAPFRRE